MLLEFNKDVQQSVTRITTMIIANVATTKAAAKLSLCLIKVHSSHFLKTSKTDEKVLYDRTKERKKKILCILMKASSATVYFSFLQLKGRGNKHEMKCL
jgi:hypothetical protein